MLARRQALAEQSRSCDVPLGRFERRLVDLLQVGGLSQDQQLVDRGNFQFVDQAQIDSQADARQQMQRLFGSDRLSAAENSERARDLVVQPFAAVAEQ